MAPAPVICIELHRLKDAYQRVISEYLLLLEAARLEAALRHTGINLSEEIRACRTAMESIKYAILKHEDEHGCA